MKRFLRNTSRRKKKVKPECGVEEQWVREERRRNEVEEGWKEMKVER